MSDGGDFRAELRTLEGIPRARLADPGAIGGAVVAAAAAIGVGAEGPPLVRSTPGGVVVAIVTAEAHLVVHTAPASGTCLVDVVARAPRDPVRGADVIARRLATP